MFILSMVSLADRICVACIFQLLMVPEGAFPYETVIESTALCLFPII